jgi:hypothetical protein
MEEPSLEPYRDLLTVEKRKRLLCQCTKAIPRYHKSLLIWSPRILTSLVLAPGFLANSLVSAGTKRASQVCSGARLHLWKETQDGRFHQPPPRAWNSVTVSVKRAALAWTRAASAVW